MSTSMSVRHPCNSRVSYLLLFSSIFLTSFPGFILSADVTLSSIEIFTSHEWLRTTPTVYFRCTGENETILPDVQDTHVFYAFKGEESWQPLTNFSGKKCKRCGFYEKDRILPDDVFDEWELCPSDFSAPDGRYVRLKDKEFNATFLCRECLSFSGGGSTPAISAPAENHNEKRKNVAVVVLLSLLFSTILILVVVSAYKYCQKKKREQDQARFLKLFEEGDEIEDELSLENIM